MHGEVHPVDENPVVRLSLGHTLVIGTFQHIVHHRLHAGPHLAHEGLVARILVVVQHRLEPIERVVHDGVDVGCHGVLAAQLTDGALHTLRVEAQIVVHQVRLYGIARPCPAVALDAVHEELARRQVHRVGCHVPNLVQFLVVTTERTRAALIEGCKLIVHQHLVVAGALVFFDIDEAEGLGQLTIDNVQRLAMLLVEGFLAALTIVDADGAL